MKKILLLTLSFFSVHLFANPLSFPHHTHGLKSHTKRPLSTQSYSGFTDFSGHWKGTCVDEAGDEIDDNDELTIKQYPYDPNTLTMDGMVYYIGSVHSENDVISGETESSHVKLRWNENYTVLEGNGVYLSSDIKDKKDDELSYNVTLSRINMSLKEKVLTTIVTFTAYDESHEAIYSGSTTCTYKK